MYLAEMWTYVEGVLMSQHINPQYGERGKIGKKIGEKKR